MQRGNVNDSHESSSIKINRKSSARNNGTERKKLIKDESEVFSQLYLEASIESYTPEEIRKVIYKNTGDGLSLYSLFKQPRVFKITLIAGLSFMKYNNIMQFIYLYIQRNKE